MRHANPLSESQMAYLVELAVSGEPTSVLEIGCGSGSFSIDLARYHDCQVLAIDIDVQSIDTARAAAAAESLRGQLEFRAAPGSEISDTYDLVICIGSSHALGTPCEALHAIRQLLKTGGHAIYADLVWSATPPQEYLQFLGSDRTLYWREQEGAEEFAKAGLDVQEQLVATTTSWREFEEQVLGERLERAKALEPDAANELRDRATKWFEMYERHGKDCLGFVAYFAKTID